MKKLLGIALGCLFSLGAFAQEEDALQAQIREANCKTANESLATAQKNTNHAKRGLRSSSWVALAESYIDLGNNLCGDSTSAEKALEAYKKALELEAGGKGTADIEAALKGEGLNGALKNQGIMYYQNNNFAEAVRALELANTVNPADTTTRLYAGVIAQQADNMEVAKRNYEEYVKIGGTDASVYSSLAFMAKKEEDYETALTYLKKGAELHPEEKSFKSEIVNIYLATDRLDEAIADLQAIVDEDPSNSANMANLGLLLDNAGKKTEAMEIYNKVLKNDPKNFDVNFNVGVMHFNEAVQIKKKVDAMDIKTYQTEGKAIEEKVCAKFNEAKPYFEMCQSINSDDSSVNDNLANLNKVLSQCK